MALPLTQIWTTISTASTASTVRDAVDVSVLSNRAVEPLGIIVFCHGLGMGAATYSDLRARWATDGFVVVAPEFSDSLRHLAAECPDRPVDLDEPTAWMSDEVVVARALDLMFDPAQWVGRVLDATSVIDQLDAIVDAPPERAPLSVIVAGHSYGAHTAQIVAGARVDRGHGLESFHHERVAGAILMSPQGSGERGLTGDSWASVDVPWLVVSGEHDIAARGQGLEWRREAYDLAPPGGRWLTVVPDADHGLGGIAGSAPIYRDDPETARHVAETTSHFAGSVLRGTAFVPAVPFPTESK